VPVGIALRGHADDEPGLREVDGDTARARSVFLFYRDTLGSPVLDVMGVWEDDLRRTQTGWKLARRTIARPE
jgi:hypothetical protein